MNGHSTKEKLLSRINREAPRKAGVYIFRDNQGKVIYIGKSVNLRQRMASYFRRNPSGNESRIQRMVFSIDEFSFQATDSELSALLLEDTLIKKHFPLYNVRQREFPGYQYLLLTEGSFPFLKIIDGSGDYGKQRIFGPFRDTYFAEKILQLVQKIFHLRVCQDPVPNQKCLRREIESCLGPCAGEIPKKDYEEIVAQAVAFLMGEEKLIVEKMRQAMEDSSAELQFEKAAKIREQIAFVNKFCKRQQFIQQFMSGTSVLYEKGGHPVTHLFMNGNHSVIKSHLSKPRLKTILSKPVNTEMNPLANDRFLLDRANIVYTWMKKNEGGYDYHCWGRFVEGCHGEENM